MKMELLATDITGFNSPRLGTIYTPVVALYVSNMT